MGGGGCGRGHESRMMGWYTVRSYGCVRRGRRGSAGVNAGDGSGQVCCRGIGSCCIRRSISRRDETLFFLSFFFLKPRISPSPSFPLLFLLINMIMPQPPIPRSPTHHRPSCSPSHDGLRRNPSHIYPRETAHKNHHTAQVLHYNRAIRHQGPEFIWSQFRISLEMVEKCILIRIVIRKGLFHPQKLFPLRRGGCAAATRGGAVATAGFLGVGLGGVVGRRGECVGGVEVRGVLGGGDCGAEGYGAGGGHFWCCCLWHFWSGIEFCM